MILYVVTWIALTCPGGMFKGMIPSNMRPLVCEQGTQFKIHYTLPEALGHIRTEGRDAKLLRCKERSQGVMVCDPVNVKWEPLAEEQ